LRSFDDGQTWEQVPAAPYPNRLATAADEERVILYIASPGGLAGQVGGQAATRAVEGQVTILGGGVYRYTTLLPSHHWVYLPLILKH
jgi:hypothetical protein